MDADVQISKGALATVTTALSPRRPEAPGRNPFGAISKGLPAMSVRRLNHAVLYTRDLDRAVDFYTTTLQFVVAHHVPGRAAALRAATMDNDHDLELFALGDQAPGPGRVGLYHLAREVGTLGELAETGRRLQSRNALAGASDNLMSKSFYAKDPDGNEFEVMWRVPRSDWPDTGDLRPRPVDLDAAIARWGRRPRHRGRSRPGHMINMTPPPRWPAPAPLHPGTSLGRRGNRASQRGRWTGGVDVGG
ncbi:VOC family protein [Nocardia sp. NPDC050193]